MHPNVVVVRTVSDARPQLQCRSKLTLAAPPLLLHGIATRVVVQSVYFDQLSAERSRELFDEFVEKWNAGDLSSKYYDMVPVSVHRTHTRTHARTHVHTQQSLCVTSCRFKCSNLCQHAVCLCCVVNDDEDATAAAS
jgi:hypothetical protein